MLEPLTPSELFHLKMAAQGWTATDVSRTYWLSTETIKFHRKHILQKLNAKNMTHAVAIAYQNGILETEGEHATTA